MMKNKLNILCAFLLSFSLSAEQQCDGETITTDTANFTIASSASGTVIHNDSGLAWARCLVGQTWNSVDESCEGEAVRLTWQGALQLTNSYDFGEHTDWRLPNLKELASLVERSCVTPAINLDIFPNTLSDSFWTSTPNTSADKTTEAWSVAFYNGRIDSRDKQQDFYVRMVRYAE